MKQTRWLSLVLFGALAQSGLHAVETINSSAGLAFPAVQEAGSARAMGLGGTYVGIAEGSASLAANSAGLAALCATEVAIHHNSTLMGSFQETAVLGMPLSADHGLGLSVNYGDNGVFEGRDTAGNLTKNYTTSAFGASVGWGFQAGDDLAFGAAGKFNRQEIAGTAFNALAMDLGALWSATPSVTFGAAYTNLGPDVAGSRLAQGLNLGVSSYLWKGGDFQWLLALSGEALIGGDDSVHAGLEANLFQMLGLRAGYSINVTNPVAANGLLGWTLGAGVKLGTFFLDYAFIPMAELGDVQRISLSYAFGECKQQR